MLERTPLSERMDMLAMWFSAVASGNFRFEAVGQAQFLRLLEECAGSARHLEAEIEELLEAQASPAPGLARLMPGRVLVFTGTYRPRPANDGASS